ncbi:MAG: 50S ribosome-binding GTPase [Planctomycetota bacterium]|nr:50S ribosome-binding GTPase [Planctomycetota bacterium]
MKMLKEQKTDTFLKHKTIASIVTPLGEGGIGKVIVSGPNALSIVNEMFEGKGIADLREAASHKLYYGHITDKGQRIDEVILNVMKRGDSFTGEDVVEVNCHGGIRVLMRIYECLQSAGAEGVGWDSLLLQSFENDKMDFIQKEALQEVIKARTKLGVKVLLDQYAGALSKAARQGLEIIERIKRSLNYKNVKVHPHPSPPPSRERESDDLPQHISASPGGRGAGGKDQLHKNGASVSALTERIKQLLETAPFGIALTSPQVLVILGKPNVGKSTLINAILGEERMLVHHEPGTTRDYVSEFISVDGVPFELVDTAGVRNTSDMLESMSIEMTQEQLRRADKVIVVFDNSRPFDHEDESILSVLNSWVKTENADDLRRKMNAHAIIPVINKRDLPAKLDRRRIESDVGQPLCYISAKNREGLEDLNSRLVQEFDTAYKPMKPILFNKRQYLLLAKADVLVKREANCLTTENVSNKTFQVIDELKDIFTACLMGS